MKFVELFHCYSFDVKTILEKFKSVKSCSEQVLEEFSQIIEAEDLRIRGWNCEKENMLVAVLYSGNWWLTSEKEQL